MKMPADGNQLPAHRRLELERLGRLSGRNVESIVAADIVVHVEVHRHHGRVARSRFAGDPVHHDPQGGAGHVATRLIVPGDIEAQPLSEVERNGKRAR